MQAETMDAATPDLLHFEQRKVAQAVTEDDATHWRHSEKVAKATGDDVPEDNVTHCERPDKVSNVASSAIPAEDMTKFFCMLFTGNSLFPSASESVIPGEYVCSSLTQTADKLLNETPRNLAKLIDLLLFPETRVLISVEATSKSRLLVYQVLL